MISNIFNKLRQFVQPNPQANDNTSFNEVTELENTNSELQAQVLVNNNRCLNLELKNRCLRNEVQYLQDKLQQLKRNYSYVYGHMSGGKITIGGLI